MTGEEEALGKRIAFLMAVAALLFLAGCTEMAEKKEEDKITISVLAGQSTSDAGAFCGWGCARSYDWQGAGRSDLC